MTTDRPRALVLRAAGTNCDVETAHALRLAGADPVVMHVNRVATDPSLLDAFAMLVIPGGFSYGDDVGAGRIFADRLTRELGDPLRRFVDAGRPVAGICNGFQVLLQTGLLPRGEGGGDRALTWNASGTFVCRWVSLRKGARHCVWTRRWGEDEAVELPVAHAEGRLVSRGEVAAAEVAAVYASGTTTLPADLGDNPNASVGGIAGLCDATGLVIGLMPHPERFIDAVQHPARGGAGGPGAAGGVPAGLRFFEAGVEAARQTAGGARLSAR